MDCLRRVCRWWNSQADRANRKSVPMKILNFLPIVLLVTICVGRIAAQPPVTQNQAEKGQESELVEGLLDLLNEPAPPATEQDSPDDKQGPSIKLTPADVGLDGEDLGEDSDNPLGAVRQSMLIAAGFLERGLTNAETQTLQSDIVDRLDEIISQLETPNENSSQNQQQQESSQESQQQNQTTQFSKPQQSPSESEQPSQENGNGEQAGDDNPGQQGAAGSQSVDMADPRALQQSVWGQLPERVRKQMQSRMVERFLPSYRAEIEAYFQALLKEK